ncbi:MAG: glycoside hydrolase family 16 protein [Chitinophagaceae bacterium]
MNYRIAIFSGCFLLTAITSIAQNKIVTAANASKAYASEGYQLVWADEFNKDGVPDTSSWSYEKGFKRNHEDQWYQEDNASCKKGMLVIEGRKESKANPTYDESSNNWGKKRKTIEYTSSSINTRGKHAWQYGRFEMRGKIDISSGLWPAWWTLGVNGEWPANGEIDIMEYYRNMLLANIACRAANGKAEWYSVRPSIDSLGGKTWASQFHVWRMDWDANAIALYVDNQLLNKVSMDKLQNKDGTGINPFNQPHYMLLNLAIGGDNGGDPSTTKFPNQYEVDYVRVYQKK